MIKICVFSRLFVIVLTGSGGFYFKSLPFRSSNKNTINEVLRL